MLLEQYRQSGQIQFVLVDVTWERNPELHHAAWCVGEQLGASAHWQFWTDFYKDHDRWWERQARNPVFSLEDLAGQELRAWSGGFARIGGLARGAESVYGVKLSLDRWLQPGYSIGLFLESDSYF